MSDALRLVALECLISNRSAPGSSSNVLPRIRCTGEARRGAFPSAFRRLAHNRHLSRSPAWWFLSTEWNALDQSIYLDANRRVRYFQFA